MDDKVRKPSTLLPKLVIIIGLPLLICNILYLIALRNPNVYHNEHEYLGYTYYSSKLNFDFNETDAIYAFDSIIGNEPEYKWILDSFYEDGYRIYFDDKFTYALCSADLFHSGNFAACVKYDKYTGDVIHGMFVNYENDFFSEVHFFHELSHYVDHKMGDISSSKEFEIIFKEEYPQSTLSDIKYYKNTKEYFAEESAYYIIYDSLKDDITLFKGTPEDAPKTFRYISEKLDEMKMAREK